MVLLLAQSAKAQTSVFDYTFPTSWGGTGTTVTDQSSAGNNGKVTGTLSLALAPTGSPGQSINTSSGGVQTTGNKLLNNSTVAAAGGFTMKVSFMWNGTASTAADKTEHLIDYAGTETLALLAPNTSSATLQMSFADNAGLELTPVSLNNILPNTWYNVALTFDTMGNSVDANGDISGTAYLYLNGSLVSSGAATKGTYGDGLNRPIGIGELGYPNLALVPFKGNIYDPSVDLGVTVVPEPSSLALGMMGGVGVLGAMWKARRRKA